MYLFKTRPKPRRRKFYLIMKEYLQKIKNFLIFPLITIGLLLIGIITFFIVYFFIDLTIYNNGNSAKYNWDIHLSFILAYIFIYFIYYKAICRYLNIIDTKISLNISFFIVTAIFLFYEGRISYFEFKNFLNRDKNPRITTLNELLENSDEMAGKEISLNDSIFDNSELKNNIENIADNTNLDWNLLDSEQDKFSIKVPKHKITKELKKQVVDNSIYEIIYYKIIPKKEDFDQNIAYQVSCTEVGQVKYDELFSSQKEYLLSVMNGDLETDFIIDSLEYPARELYFTIDNKDIKVRTRMIYCNERLYQIMVLTKNGNLFNRSIYYFINSFKPKK